MFPNTVEPLQYRRIRQGYIRSQQVDHRNPLVSRLAYLWAFHYGGGRNARNLASGAEAYAGGINAGVTWGACQDGFVPIINGANQIQIGPSQKMSVQGGGPISLFVRYQWISGAGELFSAWDYGYSLRACWRNTQNTDGSITSSIRDGGGNFSTASTPGVVVKDSMTSYGVTVNQGQYVNESLYVNGVFLGTGGGTAASIPSAEYSDYNIGRSFDSVGTLVAYIALVAVWVGRRLVPAEMTSLHADPYQLLLTIPQHRRYWWDVGVSAPPPVATVEDASVISMWS